MGAIGALIARLVPAHAEPEQLERLMRVAPTVSVMSTIGAVLTCLQYIDTPASGALKVWLALFCAVSLARVVAGPFFTRAAPAPHEARPWVVWGLASTLVHALQWGLLSIVLISPGSAEAESILHITLAAIAMGAAVHLSGFYPVLLAYVACVLGPLVVRDALIGDSYHVLMAVMSFFIGTYTLLNGRNQFRALHEILAQRHRNAELIAALRRENERSEAARRAVEEASAARTRFFAAANHDLRQPLHAMGLLAQTLRTAGPRADLDQVCGHLVECVDGMTQVVDDLLDITHMDAGSMAPQSAAFAIDALVRESAANPTEPWHAPRACTCGWRPTLPSCAATARCSHACCRTWCPTRSATRAKAPCASLCCRTRSTCN